MKVNEQDLKNIFKVNQNCDINVPKAVWALRDAVHRQHLVHTGHILKVGQVKIIILLYRFRCSPSDIEKLYVVYEHCCKEHKITNI